MTRKTRIYGLALLTTLSMMLLPAQEKQEKSIQIIDNDSKQYVETGQWQESIHTGYEGKGYRFAFIDKTQDDKKFDPNPAQAQWNFTSEKAGNYRVSTYFLKGKNRGKHVTYEIETALGTSYKVINQTGEGEGWIDLGTYPVKAGKFPVCVNAETSTDGAAVIADAMKIELINEEPMMKMSFIEYPEKLEKDKPATVKCSYEIQSYLEGEMGIFTLEVLNKESKEVVQTYSTSGFLMAQETLSFALNTSKQVTPDPRYRNNLTIEQPEYRLSFYLNDMNQEVIDQMESYERNGTYPYKWKGGDGVTKSLIYQNATIVKAKDPKGQNSTFCCGITYEVFLEAAKKLLKETEDKTIYGMDDKQMKDFFSKWYIMQAGKGYWHGPTDAFISYGGGMQIKDLKYAKKGDFVQIWRVKKGGHSVIFDSWSYDNSGKISGMRYWSSSKPTNGISFRTEPMNKLNFDPAVSKTKLTTITRAKKPVFISENENPLLSISSEK